MTEVTGRRGCNAAQCSMDDFNLFSAQDRQDVSYRACIGGSVVLGAAVGSFATGFGALAGAATGLAIGLLTCKRLAPAIEHKLFNGLPLSEAELSQVLRTLRDEAVVRTKSDAMYLLTQVRHIAACNPASLRGNPPVSMPMRAAAAQLLSRRA
jgi:hypothetical protein